jgi:hypothetical protein
MGMGVDRYTPEVISPEGTVVRWGKGRTHGSEEPPPSIDECPPPGVEGELSEDLGEKGGADPVRIRAEKNAKRAFGEEDEDIPWYAKN